MEPGGRWWWYEWDSVRFDVSQCRVYFALLRSEQRDGERDGDGRGADVGSEWMYGDAVECVLAADEYADGDAAAGSSAEYGEYGAGVFGGGELGLYGDGERCGDGWELCGPEREWCERNGAG